MLGFFESFDFCKNEKEYVYEYNVTGKGEKASASIYAELNFSKEPKEEQKQAESVCGLADTTATHSANTALSQRDTSEIQRESTAAVVTLDSGENSEITHESKQGKKTTSNFSNARVF